MRLHGLQSGIAQRHAGRLLSASSFAPAGCRCRCSSRRASSPPSLGRIRFPPEARQNAFGNFQLIELIAELCPFGVKPREPLGNPLFLLSNLVYRSHLPSPSSSPQYRPDTTALVFSDK
jgi:hypothetical protein